MRKRPHSRAEYRLVITAPSSTQLPMVWVAELHTLTHVEAVRDMSLSVRNPGEELARIVRMSYSTGLFTLGLVSQVVVGQEDVSTNTRVTHEVVRTEESRQYIGHCGQ